MAKTDQDPISRKFSRRRFLEIAAGFGIGAALPPWQLRIPRGESSLPTKPNHPGTGEDERKNTYEFTREETLKNPLRFIDTILDRINAMSPEQQQALPNAVRSFYGNFALEDRVNTNWDAASPSEQESFRRDKEQFRRTFAEGYKRYGERICELARRVDKVSQISPEPGTYFFGSFNALATWWNPLDALRVAFEPTNPNYDFFTFNHLDQLIDLKSWFQNLTKDATYEDQRSRYLDEATVASNWMRDATLDVWDANQKGELPPIRQGIEHIYTPHHKEVYKRLLQAFENTYLGAFTQTRSLDVIHIWMRSHYQRGPNTVTLDETFFYVVQMLESLEADAQSGNELDDYTISSLLEQLDYFLLTLKHELGHGFDLNQTAYYQGGYGTRIPYGVHPQDHLDAAEARLTFTEQFEQAVRGDDTHQPLTYDALTHWGVHPLAPKNYGVDQIASQGQFESFNGDINILISIWEDFERLSEDTQSFWLSITGMKELIHGSQFKLPVWLMSLKQQGYNPKTGEYEDQPALQYSGITFDRLSSRVLRVMQRVAGDTWNNPPSGDRANVLQSLVQAKESFVFLTYAFLDRLVAKGLISTRSDSTMSFAYNFQALQTGFIYEQNLHGMVGPYGQYFPSNAEFTIRKNVLDQIADTKKRAIIENQTKDRNYGTRLTWQKRLTSTLEGLCDQLARTQITMQKAMGMPLTGNQTDRELLNRDLDLFHNVALALSDVPAVQKALTTAKTTRG